MDAKPPGRLAVHGRSRSDQLGLLGQPTRHFLQSRTQSSDRLDILTRSRRRHGHLTGDRVEPIVLKQSKEPRADLRFQRSTVGQVSYAPPDLAPPNYSEKPRMGRQVSETGHCAGPNDGDDASELARPEVACVSPYLLGVEWRIELRLGDDAIPMTFEQKVGSIAPGKLWLATDFDWLVGL